MGKLEFEKNYLTKEARNKAIEAMAECGSLRIMLPESLEVKCWKKDVNGILADLEALAEGDLRFYQYYRKEEKMLEIAISLGDKILQKGPYDRLEEVLFDFGAAER